MNIERCVRSALAALESSNLEGEVIVVDNGSEDRSAELAAAAGARVIHELVAATAAPIWPGLLPRGAPTS
jgi:glycosyltransferase involved in cell wall biosynthesis